MTLIAKDKIAGNDVDIHANSTGRWYIYEPDTESGALGSGETLEQAKNQARATLAKQKVKVEVKFVDRTGKRGIAHGIHAKSRDTLVRWSNGESGTYGGH